MGDRSRVVDDSLSLTLAEASAVLPRHHDNVRMSEARLNMMPMETTESSEQELIMCVMGSFNSKI